MTIRSGIKFYGSLLILFMLGSCAGAVRVDNGLVGRLKNRGMVPLSPDNPYLAANLLVSKEMDKSEELRGFVQHRGAPAAVAVEKSPFSSLMMKFYYPERDEFYSLEDVEDSWIISGPYPVPPSELGQLASYTRKSALTPKLAFKQTAPESRMPRTEDELQSPPGPSAQEGSASAKTHGFQSPPLPSFVPTQPDLQTPRATSQSPTAGESAAIDRIIEASPKTSAEISPRGDLVHYVTYPGETLSIIARWYTGDRDNAVRLARINEMKNADKLGLGDQVIVPAYMVKNKFRLTREAIDGFKALAYDH